MPLPTSDPALDDTELGVARAALAQGRRQPARSLLARTGDDWDRRAHRVAVLALEPYAAAWAHEWLLADPACADAAVLLALAQVGRVLRGQEDAAVARAACREAAELAPADPTPGSGCSGWSATAGRRRSGSSRRSGPGTATTTTPTT